MSKLLNMLSVSKAKYEYSFMHVWDHAALPFYPYSLFLKKWSPFAFFFWWLQRQIGKKLHYIFVFSVLIFIGPWWKYLISISIQGWTGIWVLSVQSNQDHLGMLLEVFPLYSRWVVIDERICTSVHCTV